MPTRQKFFSDEERRAHKAAVARLKVYLKTQFHRWREFRAKYAFTTDDQVAKFLLDWFDVVESELAAASQSATPFAYDMKDDPKAVLMSISNKLADSFHESTPWKNIVLAAKANLPNSASISSGQPSSTVWSASTETLSHPRSLNPLVCSSVNTFPLTTPSLTVTGDSPLPSQQMPPPSLPPPRLNSGSHVMKPPMPASVYLPYTPVGLYQGFGRIRSVVPMHMGMSGDPTVPTTGSFMPMNQVGLPPTVPTVAAMRAMALPQQTFPSTVHTVLSTMVPSFNQPGNGTTVTNPLKEKDEQIKDISIPQAVSVSATPVFSALNMTNANSISTRTETGYSDMSNQSNCGSVGTHSSVYRDRVGEKTETENTYTDPARKTLDGRVSKKNMNLNHVPVENTTSATIACGNTTTEVDPSVGQSPISSCGNEADHLGWAQSMDVIPQIMTHSTAERTCAVATSSVSTDDRGTAEKGRPRSTTLTYVVREPAYCVDGLKTPTPDGSTCDPDSCDSSRASVSASDIKDSVLPQSSEPRIPGNLQNRAVDSREHTDVVSAPAAEFQSAPCRRLGRYGLKANHRKMRRRETSCTISAINPEPRMKPPASNGPTCNASSAHPYGIREVCREQKLNYFEIKPKPLNLKTTRTRDEGSESVSQTSDLSDLEKRRKFIKECGLKIKIFMGKIVSQAVRSVNKLDPQGSQRERKHISRSFLASAIAKQLRNPLLSDGKSVDMNNNITTEHTDDTGENYVPTPDEEQEMSAGRSLQLEDVPNTSELLHLRNFGDTFPPVTSVSASPSNFPTDDVQEHALDLTTKNCGGKSTRNDVPVRITKENTKSFSESTHTDGKMQNDMFCLPRQPVVDDDLDNQKFLCDRLRWAGVAVDPEADLELACGGVYQTFDEEVTQEALASSLGLCRKDAAIFKRKHPDDSYAQNRKSKVRCLRIQRQSYSEVAPQDPLNLITNKPLDSKPDEVLSEHWDTKTETVPSEKLESLEQVPAGTGWTKKKKRVKQPCPLCPRMFHNNALPNHLKKHAAEQLLACMHCGNQLGDEESAKEHLLSHHSQTEPAFSCEHCHAKFWLEDNLMKHLKSAHEKLDKRECLLCGKIFADHHSLKQHIASVHEKIRRRACSWPGCAKRFKTKHHLDQHLRLHTGEKPYSCALCSYSAAQQNSLNYHMRTRHHTSPIQLRTRHGVIMRQGPVTRQCITALKKKKRHIRVFKDKSSIEARETATRHMLEAIDAVAQGRDDVHPKERLDSLTAANDKDILENTNETEPMTGTETTQEKVYQRPDYALVGPNSRHHEIKEELHTETDNKEDEQTRLEGGHQSGKVVPADFREEASSPTISPCDEDGLHQRNGAITNEPTSNIHIKGNLPPPLAMECNSTAIDLSVRGKNDPSSFDGKECSDELTNRPVGKPLHSNSAVCKYETDLVDGSKHQIEESPGKDIRNNVHSVPSSSRVNDPIEHSVLHNTSNDENSATYESRLTKNDQAELSSVTSDDTRKVVSLSRFGVDRGEIKQEEMDPSLTIGSRMEAFTEGPQNDTAGEVKARTGTTHTVKRESRPFLAGQMEADTKELLNFDHERDDFIINAAVTEKRGSCALTNKAEVNAGETPIVTNKEGNINTSEVHSEPDIRDELPQSVRYASERESVSVHCSLEKGNMSTTPSSDIASTGNDETLERTFEKNYNSDTPVHQGKRDNMTSAHVDLCKNVSSATIETQNQQCDMNQLNTPGPLTCKEMEISYMKNSLCTVPLIETLELQQRVTPTDGQEVVSSNDMSREKDDDKHLGRVHLEGPADSATDIDQKFDILALAMKEVRTLPTVAMKEDLSSPQLSTRLHTGEQNIKFEENMSSVRPSGMGNFHREMRESHLNLNIPTPRTPSALDAPECVRSDLIPVPGIDTVRAGSCQPVDPRLCTGFKREWIDECSAEARKTSECQDLAHSLQLKFKPDVQLHNAQSKLSMRDPTFKPMVTVMNLPRPTTDLPNFITNVDTQTRKSIRASPDPSTTTHYTPSPQAVDMYSRFAGCLTTASTPFSATATQPLRTQYYQPRHPGVAPPCPPRRTQPIRILCYPARRPWTTDLGAQTGAGPAVFVPRTVPSTSSASVTSNATPSVSAIRAVSYYPSYTSNARLAVPNPAMRQPVRTNVAASELNVPSRYDVRPFTMADYPSRPEYQPMIPPEFHVPLPKRTQPQSPHLYGYASDNVQTPNRDTQTGGHCSSYGSTPHLKATRSSFSDPVWSQAYVRDTITPATGVQQASSWSSSLGSQPSPNQDPMWNVAANAEVQREVVDHTEPVSVHEQDDSEESKNSGTDIEEWEGLLMQRSAARQW